jgi:hypothetical protein
LKVLILNDEQVAAIAYACEDAGELYLHDEEDHNISLIGDILLNQVLPQLMVEGA